MATIMRAAPTTEGTMTCDIAYGKANYTTSSTTFACMKVEAPFVRSSGANSGKVQSRNWQLAGQNNSHGGFSHCRVEHRIGTILLFQGTRMSGGMPVAEGALFVRLRPTGPMHTIYGHLPTSTNNSIGDEVEIATLRGDFLTLEDLQLLNIEVPRLFRQRFLQQEEIAELFSAMENLPETSPRPQLVAWSTEQGTKVQEVAAAPVRRLRFRGRGE